MPKYFFDRVNDTRKELDFQGCELATIARAAEMAELIALDLSIDDGGEWVGWVIRVSDENCRDLLTIPVREFDLAS